MVQLERTANSIAAMPTSTPAKLRQIAILLHSLPSRTHGVLLGQLSSSDQERVQVELTQLGDVDPLEQFRIMKQMREHLTRETKSIDEVESEIHDEIQIGRARVSQSRKPTLYHNPETSFQTNQAPAEAALSEAATNGVAPMVTKDATHAQASPSDSGQRQHAGKANQFTIGTEPHQEADPSPVAIHSIDAYRQPCELDSMQVLIEQYQQTQAAGILNSNYAGVVQGGPSTTAPTTQPAASEMPRHNSQSVDSTSPLDGRVPMNAEQMAQRIDQFLINLPPEDLCYALGVGTTKQAFLVLCGLPNATAEAALKRLPRKEAKQVRNAMRGMNQLQISEIDQAKRAIAEIAIRIAIGHKALAA